MASVRNPSLYQINTRVWLRAQVGPALPLPFLDAFTDAYLDGLAERGFDWVWLLGVWQTGPAGRGCIAERIHSGGQESPQRPCPISARATSPARHSQSRRTPSMSTSAAPRPWHACAIGCGGAASA